MFQLLVDKSDCATDILPPEEIQAEQMLAAGGIFPIGSDAKKQQDYSLFMLVLKQYVFLVNSIRYLDFSQY